MPSLCVILNMFKFKNLPVSLKIQNDDAYPLRWSYAYVKLRRRAKILGTIISVLQIYFFNYYGYM